MRESGKRLIPILFLLVGCAKRMEGAGSASVIPPSSETITLTSIETLIETDKIMEENKNEFKFGIGASNLRPYLIAGLRWRDYTVGLGLGGIIFSGLEKEYNVITSDLSLIIKIIKGKNAFMGVGGGIGGALASDLNWSREGQRTNLTEGHAYVQMNVAASPSGSSVSFSTNLRLGVFFIKTPVFLDIANELEQQGEKFLRKKDNIAGLTFIPSLGFNIPMVENKVFLYIGFTLPLTSFLIFEPDYHPYVPSFNFAFTF